MNTKTIEKSFSAGEINAENRILIKDLIETPLKYGNDLWKGFFVKGGEDYLHSTVPDLKKASEMYHKTLRMIFFALEKVLLLLGKVI